MSTESPATEGTEPMEPSLQQPAATPSWMKPTHPVAIAATLLAVAYAFGIFWHRFRISFAPWVAEGDAKQVLWMFYQIADPGSLAGKSPLLDYSWAYNAPPLYRMIMTPLSVIMDPIMAGHGLAMVLWVVALIGAYKVVAKHTHHFGGLCATILLAHCVWWERNLAGGYPRATGGTMTILFLLAWTSGKRRTCLVLLVIMSGLYPSPMMGCALAFGIWTVWQFARDRKWRPVLELAIASVFIFGFALSQDLQTPDWYGPTVWFDDVVHHPAWQRGSRFEFIPLPTISSEIRRYLGAFFIEIGTPALKDLGRWDRAHYHVIGYAPVVVLGLLGVARRRQFGFPPRLLLLFGGAFLAFVLARILAFKLHVPTRPLTHMWPVLLAAITTISIFGGLRAWLPRKPAVGVLLGIALSLAPMLLMQGTGFDKVNIYSDNQGDARLYMWIQKHIQREAVFAGEFRGMDTIGLFGHRTPYVNWTLAHPYRLGYFNEIERRTSRMYEAYWASDLDTVIKFADEEKVTHFLLDVRRYDTFEDKRSKVRPFPPLRAAVRPFFDNGKRKGFALHDAKEAVLFSHRFWRVVSVDKIRKLAKQKKANAASAAPSADGGDEDARDADDTDDEAGADEGAPEAP